MLLVTCVVAARAVWFAAQVRRSVREICSQPVGSNQRLAALHRDLAPVKAILPSGTGVEYIPQPTRSVAARDTSFQLMRSAMAPRRLSDRGPAEYLLADFDSAEQLEQADALRDTQVVIAIRPGLALLRRPRP